jgi:hypothetical protein
MSFFKEFLSIVLDSFHHDAQASAKRLTGFAGWATYLFCMILSLHKEINMPDGSVPMLMLASSLLGLDVLADALTGKTPKAK